MKYLILLIVLCFNGLALTAQNAVEDLKKCNKLFDEAKTVDYNIRVDIYKQCNSSKPSQQFFGRKVKDGNNYYSNINGVITIVLKDICVIVNTKTKTIYCATPQSIKDKEIPLISAYKESVFKKEFTTSLIKSDNSCKIYEIIPKVKVIYKKIQVKIDLPSFQLGSITYFFYEKSEYCKSISYYSDIKYNQRVDKQLFNTNKYITKVHSKYIPSNGYINYHVSDIRNTNNMK